MSAQVIVRTGMVSVDQASLESVVNEFSDPLFRVFGLLGSLKTRVIGFFMHSSRLGFNYQFGHFGFSFAFRERSLGGLAFEHSLQNRRQALLTLELLEHRASFHAFRIVFGHFVKRMEILIAPKAEPHDRTPVLIATSVVASAASPQQDTSPISL